MNPLFTSEPTYWLFSWVVRSNSCLCFTLFPLLSACSLSLSLLCAVLRFYDLSSKLTMPAPPLRKTRRKSRTDKWVWSLSCRRRSCCRAMCTQTGAHTDKCGISFDNQTLTIGENVFSLIFIIENFLSLSAATNDTDNQNPAAERWFLHQLKCSLHHLVFKKSFFHLSIWLLCCGSFSVSSCFLKWIPCLEFLELWV